MVICLERGADLHMAQLMPLPLTVSCFSEIQIGFTFLVLAHPGSPGIRAVKRVWPFSGLPLFQEQDIMYFCYACRNEIFCECKSQRAYVPGSERSRKLLLPGTKIPGSEHSNNILSTPVVYLYCYCFVIAKRRSCECI